MSIEAILKELIVAVNNNTAALSAAPAVLRSNRPADTPAASKPADAASKPASKPATPAPDVTYDTVKAPFLALVKTNRQLALDTIGAEPFKLANLKDAKPEQFAGLLKAIENALATSA